MPQAQVQITDLPQALALTGTESVPIVQNGVTVQTTTGAISGAGALNFPFFGEKAPDSKILEYAAKKIAEANHALRKNWNMTQERVLQHYRNRRWLPLVFSIKDGINEEVTPEQQEAAKKALEMSADSLDGYAILGTIDLLNDKKDTPWFDRALKVNAKYGEAYAIAAHFGPGPRTPVA